MVHHEPNDDVHIYVIFQHLKNILLQCDEIDEAEHTDEWVEIDFLEVVVAIITTIDVRDDEVVPLLHDDLKHDDVENMQCLALIDDL